MPTIVTARVNRARLIPAAILAILVYGMISSVLGVLMSSFQLTPDENGTLAAVKAVGLVIASLVIGPIIDLRGKKAALAGGMFLISVALLLLPNAKGFTLLATCFLVLFLGGGMVVTGSNALASDVGEENRGTTLNLLNLFFGLGGFVTPFIATYFFPNNPIALGYVLGIFCAATFLLELLTPMPAPTGQVAFRLSDAGRMIGQPKLLLLSLLLFFYVAAEVGVWDWLVRFLTAEGFAEAEATKILSFGFAIGLLVGRLVVSRILLKVPAITVTLFSAIAMAVTTYLVTQVGTPAVTGVLVFCAGLAMAPVFPTTLAMVGDAYPVGTATAMGIAITSGWIGLVVSSKIIGVVAAAHGYKSGLLVLPAVSVLMILVNLTLRPLMKKPALGR
jgi:fucose permease